MSESEHDQRTSPQFTMAELLRAVTGIAGVLAIAAIVNDLGPDVSGRTVSAVAFVLMTVSTAILG